MMITKASLLLLSVLVAIQAAPSTRSCHSSDYIQCAFVIVGCTSTCSGCSDWMNCMINCVINQHHEECIDCISRLDKADVQDVETDVDVADMVPDVAETAEEAEPEERSCHSSDYIKCAFVIAGCTSTCSGSQDWMNCMINCVINQHQEECIDCISK
eukprot:GFUD01005920.1.p1 GENE.GFUD01005920.1~~GFUD01005920.1.p1  ORF type:complete len:157 (-),score=53.10 GFUD01005920.1:558-1028(-)